MLALIAASLIVPTPLQQYFSKEEPPRKIFELSGKEEKGGKRTLAKFTTVKWQSIQWKHELEIYEPKVNEFEGVCILIITGDRGSHDQDIQNAWKLAEIAKMQVAVLYDVPNQPLFDKLREDELIAHTFGKFLETGDVEWPLLFPMAKSTLKAMDAIQEITGKRTKQFILTGASKRGWTTYLAAASDDSRIIGLSPMVFDFLKFAEQTKHQKDLWGTRSQMLEAYEKLNPDEVIKNPRGQELINLVDPYTHRKLLYKPKLLILGANDPFWALDAAALYWQDMPGQKSLLYVPNSGHGLEDTERVLDSLAAFSRLAAKKIPLPEISNVFPPTWSPRRPALASYSISISAPGSVITRLWYAESNTLNFSESKWKVAGEGPQDTVLSLPNNTNFAYRACFVEAEYTFGGIRFCQSTIPHFIKRP